MKIAFCLLSLAITFHCQGQSLSNTNFRYWYDPDNAGQFDVKIVRAPDSMFAYFQVDTTIFALDWERRD